MFITKEYDFHDAICKFLNVAVDDVLIDKVLTISNHANVYMKVARVI